MSRIDKLAKLPVEELKRKDMKKSVPSGSAVIGGPTFTPPSAEPLLVHKAKEDKEPTEGEDVEDEDLKAPLELLMKFLRALMDKDFQLAVTLCQMILICEPDNPEASEFLPLIQKKLLEVEQDAEQSEAGDEEEEDGDDADDDDGSDQDSSHSSNCPSSPCSSCSASDDEDEEEEKQVNRHKPCPPAHIYP